MRAVMRIIEAAAVAAALWIATASAEESTAARSRAIVERQFDAFARDDAEGAYALADPTIKQMFVDADHFMAMVREHYAPVYRHRSVEFGAFSESGDEASLEATLVDNDNVEWTALYIPAHAGAPFPQGNLDRRVQDVAGEDADRPLRSELDAKMAGRVPGRGAERQMVDELMNAVHEARFARLHDGMDGVLEHLRE